MVSASKMTSALLLAAFPLIVMHPLVPSTRAKVRPDAFVRKIDIITAWQSLITAAGHDHCGRNIHTPSDDATVIIEKSLVRLEDSTARIADSVPNELRFFQTRAVPTSKCRLQYPKVRQHPTLG